MRSNKILVTTMMVVLSGFTSVANSATDAAFVNVDYSIHADGTGCAAPGAAADTNSDGLADSGQGFEAGEFLPTWTNATFNTVGIRGGLLSLDNGTLGCRPAVTGGSAAGVPTSEGPYTVPTFFFSMGKSTWDTTGELVFTGTEGGIIDGNSNINNSGKTNADYHAGKPYSVEILQSGTVSLPSGLKGDGTTKTPKYAAVVYTIDGWLNETFGVTFTLDGAVFDGEPILGISNTDVAIGSAVSAGTKYYAFSNFEQDTAASGKDSVQFLVTPTVPTVNGTAVKKGAPDNRLNNGTLFLLLYRIKSATGLQTAGGEVTMATKFEAAAVGKIGAEVQRPLEVTVATAENSLDARMYEEDDGTVYISVNDESKLFTDKNGNIKPSGAFRSTTTARIGYIELGADQTTFQPDGIQRFTIGNDLGKAGKSTQLMINTGQFAASVNAPGQVRLVAINTAGAESEIVNVASDGQDAIFNLTDANLAAMYAADKVAIDFVVDTATEVNLVETPPTATLTIMFDDEKIAMDGDLKDTLVEIPMRQIFQDGVVCWAFNVPYATVQDRFNIRITNESAVAGAMTVTLYEASGSEVVSAELTNDSGKLSVLKSEADMGTGTGTVQNLLPAGQTLFLNSEILEAALSTSWTGRAVLRIVSELPELEMLAMLRNQLMDDASQPLNNLSLGAQGISCTQGQ